MTTESLLGKRISYLAFIPANVSKLFKNDKRISWASRNGLIPLSRKCSLCLSISRFHRQISSFSGLGSRPAVPGQRRTWVFLLFSRLCLSCPSFQVQIILFRSFPRNPMSRSLSAFVNARRCFSLSRRALNALRNASRWIPILPVWVWQSIFHPPISLTIFIPPWSEKWGVPYEPMVPIRSVTSAHDARASASRLSKSHESRISEIAGKYFFYRICFLIPISNFSSGTWQRNFQYTSRVHCAVLAKAPSSPEGILALLHFFWAWFIQPLRNFAKRLFRSRGWLINQKA